MKIIYVFLFAFGLFACTQKEVEELEDFSGDSGTFTDSRDKHIYNWVKIDDKIWMAENLAFLPSVYPTDSGSYTEPRYYVYGYTGSSLAEVEQQENYSNFGVLYNWSAAITASPPGWHLPSDEEWKQLELFLGMTEEEVAAAGWRGNEEGMLLKATTGWNSNGSGTDSLGFTALPGGLRGTGEGFNKLRISGYWWNSTGKSSNEAWYRVLYWSNGKICRYFIDKDYGFSVRCIKD